MRKGDLHGVPVVVEVLLFNVYANGLGYRVVRGPLTGGEHPDRVAADLATAPVTGPDSGGADGDDPHSGATVLPLSVLHSTSWRHADGAVVLSYAAVPDPYPTAGASPVVMDAVASSADPARPSPAQVCLDAVAAHAVRHLAWLRRTDEAVATALAAHPPVWHALDTVAAGPAGALTSQPTGEGALLR